MNEQRALSFRTECSTHGRRPPHNRLYPTMLSKSISGSVLSLMAWAACYKQNLGGKRPFLRRRQVSQGIDVNGEADGGQHSLNCPILWTLLGFSALTREQPKAARDAFNLQLKVRLADQMHHPLPVAPSAPALPRR